MSIKDKRGRQFFYKDEVDNLDDHINLSILIQCPDDPGGDHVHGVVDEYY